MSRLEKIHEQRRQAELEINALQLHCALLTEAIASGKVEQAEAQLGHLVRGLHGPSAVIARTIEHPNFGCLHVRILLDEGASP